MAHLFTAGCFAFNEPAWHKLGTVIPGTLPPAEMFNTAQALFPVEAMPLWAGDPSQPDQMIPMSKLRKAIYRSDTREVLGTAGPEYQIIPNSRLLDFANSIREEAEMDAVVVLAKGARVVFTAKIRDAGSDVIPGDTMLCRIVGYLGHDGKTAFGGMYNSVRVVCQNTFNLANAEASRHNRQFTVRHTAGEIAQIDDILAGIDVARREFTRTVDQFKAMQATPMSFEGFRHFLEAIYQVPAVVRDEHGNSRKGSIEDMPRKFAALTRAWNYGLGADLPGVKGTLWGGLNAVTEVESSPISEVHTASRQGAGERLEAARRRLNSAFFGSGASVIRRAEDTARALAGIA